MILDSTLHFPKDCFEYNDGTGLKIGGRYLQQWAGCNFGHTIPAIFYPFLVAAKRSTVGFYSNILISW
jgi:hypothetical protein